MQIGTVDVMKKLLCAVLGALMFCSCSGNGSEEKESRSLFAMDTYMTLTAYGENAEAGLDAAEKMIKELESKWSVTDSGSEIYKINSSGGKPVEVSSETVDIVSNAVSMNRETFGALDISVYPVLREWGFTASEYKVPDDARISELLENVGAERITLSDGKITVPDNMMIDLGSVAKGRTADLAKEKLTEKGVDSAILNLGGNVQTLGSKPDGSPWAVGIKDPYSDGLLGTLDIEGEKAVVTSGGYERCFTENGKTYHHILDPKTGYPAESGFVSVTVVGSSGLRCDALSTAIFVLGFEKAEQLRKSDSSFDYIALTTDGEILATKEIADSFTVDGGHNDLKVTVVE